MASVSTITADQSTALVQLSAAIKSKPGITYEDIRAALDANITEFFDLNIMNSIMTFFEEEAIKNGQNDPTKPFKGARGMSTADKVKAHANVKFLRSLHTTLEADANKGSPALSPLSFPLDGPGAKNHQTTDSLPNTALGGNNTVAINITDPWGLAAEAAAQPPAQPEDGAGQGMEIDVYVDPNIFDAVQPNGNAGQGMEIEDTENPAKPKGNVGSEIEESAKPKGNVDSEIAESAKPKGNVDSEIAESAKPKGNVGSEIAESAKPKGNVGSEIEESDQSTTSKKRRRGRGRGSQAGSRHSSKHKPGGDTTGKSENEPEGSSGKNSEKRKRDLTTRQDANSCVAGRDEETGKRKKAAESDRNSLITRAFQKQAAEHTERDNAFQKAKKANQAALQKKLTEQKKEEDDAAYINGIQAMTESLVASYGSRQFQYDNVDPAAAGKKACTELQFVLFDGCALVENGTFEKIKKLLLATKMCNSLDIDILSEHVDELHEDLQYNVFSVAQEFFKKIQTFTEDDYDAMAQYVHRVLNDDECRMGAYNGGIAKIVCALTCFELKKLVKSFFTNVMLHGIDESPLRLGRTNSEQCQASHESTKKEYKKFDEIAARNEAEQNRGAHPSTTKDGERALPAKDQHAKSDRVLVPPTTNSTDGTKTNVICKDVYRDEQGDLRDVDCGNEPFSFSLLQKASLKALGGPGPFGKAMLTELAEKCNENPNPVSRMGQKYPFTKHTGDAPKCTVSSMQTELMYWNQHLKALFGFTQWALALMLTTGDKVTSAPPASTLTALQIATAEVDKQKKTMAAQQAIQETQKQRLRENFPAFEDAANFFKNGPYKNFFNDQDAWQCHAGGIQINQEEAKILEDIHQKHTAAENLNEDATKKKSAAFKEQSRLKKPEHEEEAGKVAQAGLCHDIQVTGWVEGLLKPFKDGTAGKFQDILKREDAERVKQEAIDAENAERERLHTVQKAKDVSGAVREFLNCVTDLKDSIVDGVMLEENIEMINTSVKNVTDFGVTVRDLCKMLDGSSSDAMKEAIQSLKLTFENNPDMCYQIVQIQVLLRDDAYNAKAKTESLLMEMNNAAKKLEFEFPDMTTFVSQLQTHCGTVGDLIEGEGGAAEQAEPLDKSAQKPDAMDLCNDDDDDAGAASAPTV